MLSKGTTTLPLHLVGIEVVYVYFKSIMSQISAVVKQAIYTAKRL
jgi:hypothetical protein